MTRARAVPTSLAEARAALTSRPRRWLVTGAAGFIGSHLLEALMGLGQEVVGLDDFSTGSRANLDDVSERVAGFDARFRLVEGDIRDESVCRDACDRVQIVMHQAALGSVPRSIADPVATHGVNATGSLNLLDAASAAGVERFVYASSSAVYGDDAHLPKVEERVGRPLSPYAASKVATEAYAAAFAHTHRLEVIGLRYFNVFGPRQNPDGPYSAVIPRWIAALIEGRPIEIYGDGETSRDFCYVANVVQANLLAAARSGVPGQHRVYNIAVGQRTSLNALLEALRKRLPEEMGRSTADHLPFREGDVPHSLADIGRAATELGYIPTHGMDDGVDETVRWYLTGRNRRG